MGCPLPVPKSPLTPAIAPALADMVLVSAHIGYCWVAGAISGTTPCVSVRIRICSGPAETRTRLRFRLGSSG